MAVLAGEVVAGETHRWIGDLGSDGAEGARHQLLAVGDQSAIGHVGHGEAWAVDAVVGPSERRQRSRAAARTRRLRVIADERHRGACKDKCPGENVRLHRSDDAMSVAPDSPKSTSTIPRNC